MRPCGWDWASPNDLFALFTVSSVKLHHLLREVDFCRALRNVPVLQTYKILCALKSGSILLKQNFVPFALLRLFCIYITTGFASSWNQIGILLGKFIPVFVFPQVIMFMSVLFNHNPRESTLLHC
jgi:hypothetical protein